MVEEKKVLCGINRCNKEMFNIIVGNEMTLNLCFKHFEEWYNQEE